MRRVGDVLLRRRVPDFADTMASGERRAERDNLNPDRGRNVARNAARLNGDVPALVAADRRKHAIVVRGTWDQKVLGVVLAGVVADVRRRRHRPPARYTTSLVRTM